MNHISVSYDYVMECITSLYHMTGCGGGGEEEEATQFSFVTTLPLMRGLSPPPPPVYSLSLSASVSPEVCQPPRTTLCSRKNMI